jgi:hypothetical protein
MPNAVLNVIVHRIPGITPEGRARVACRFQKLKKQKIERPVEDSFKSKVICSLLGISTVDESKRRKFKFSSGEWTVFRIVSLP